MPKEIIMPALGMAQETGILIEWFKAEGDTVTQGEPLMEIETDKAAVEIEAPVSGVLAHVTAQPGDKVPVGQTIALILAPGESAPQPAAVSEAAPAPVTEVVDKADKTEVLASPLAKRVAAEHQVDLAQVKAAGSRIQKEDVLAYVAAQQKEKGTNGRLLASPKARRLAREQHLELAAIAGSGPDGAVLAADVLTAAESVQMEMAEPAAVASAPASPIETQTVPMSRMWQVMAERLTESWTTVPHFYLEREVNAGQLLAWWEKVKQRVEDKITLTDLLVKLVAAALRKHPRANAAWQDGAIVLNSEVNVGLAVAVEDGLLVPVIHQTDTLGLGALAERRQAVVDRARAGKPALADLQGGTFTVSNLGMFGIDSFKAIVNPPQAAILAVGRIADKVVPVNGQPTVQPMMTLTLSCDHRVVDGARGAQFLQTVASFIEEPLAVLD
ncbi:MAG TPA: dihydrolipoamide acetyltransferase family protein [Anaerolineae bacterium]|nr:dihydrolipoamide acetyltransferase family protein [Anaerolineae bacterium]